MVELPETLKPLSWLAGKWISKNGHGVYPTIKDFKYHEVLEFSCLGQPMFFYSATSSHPEKQTPMHIEKGFLRLKPDTKNIALIISHNFGLSTIEEGSYDESNMEINLKSSSIARMSFAKPPAVLKIERSFKLLDDGSLRVMLAMETDNTKMTKHLDAIYVKESP